MTLVMHIRHAFDGFSLDISVSAPAGVTAIYGHSGCGKTSLINAVAGLLHPNFGRIALDGRVIFDSAARISLPVHQRRIGYVFQEARLFPHMTVFQNLLYGQRFARDTSTISVAAVAEMLGLNDLMARKPLGLSGGEAQRVAIGRALLSNPQLLVMDEPLASLDAARKAEILPYLEMLRDQVGLPILYVSHALSEVARLATTMVILEAGRVVRAGAVAEILADPTLAPTLGLRDAGAILPVVLQAQEADGLTRVQSSAGPLWVPKIAGEIGQLLRIRISAQDVIVSRDRPTGLSALNILPAEVTVLRLGDGPGALVQLRVGQDLILVRMTRRSVSALELAIGTPCFAILKSVAIAKNDVAPHL